MADEDFQSILTGVKERAQDQADTATTQPKDATPVVPTPSAAAQPVSSAPIDSGLSQVLQGVKDRAEPQNTEQAQPPQLNEDEVLKSAQQKRQQMEWAAQSGAAASTITAQAVKRIASAFGQGVVESAGGAVSTLQSLSANKEDLDKYPVKGEDAWQNSINEFVVRPFIQASGAGMKVLGAAGSLVSTPFSAAASAAQQFGVESGNEGLQKELGFLTSPETAFALGLHEAPEHVDVNNVREFVTKPPLPPEVARAVDNGIITPSDPTLKVEAAQTTAAIAKVQRMEAQKGLVTSEVTPGLHDIVRQDNPELFNTYDRLTPQLEEARSRIHDPEIAGKEYDDKLANLKAQREENLRVPVHLEGTELDEAVQKSNVRDAEIAAQIKELGSRNKYIADSREEARTRFQQLDEQLRDITPDVNKAYAEAAPKAKEAAFSVPAEAKPFTDETAPVEAVQPKETTPTFDIAADVKKKLSSEGRTKEQAEHESQIIAARYETAAAKGWAPGSAAEIYQKHMAQVKDARRNKTKTKASELAQTDIAKTPEFTKWFGSSKVVDSEGKPLVVYHATTKDFSKFDRNAKSDVFDYGGRDAGGHFFGTDNQSIDYYVAKGNGRLEEGANVVPVYLSIENPIEIKGNHSLEEQARLLHDAEAAGYDGARVDGDQWVAFKPEQIKSVHNEGTFDKTNPDILKQSDRGNIKLATRNSGKAIIKLFKKNDASTLMHEMAHHWLDEMSQWEKAEDAPKDLKDHMDAVRNWLGTDKGDFSGFTRDQHEKFARGFERYLREGVAPSAKLANAFAHFKAWLSKIYDTADKLKVEISPEIRNVFDHMLAVNPERITVADEHAPAKAIADIHEADARSTPPEQADAVGDTVAKEVDTTAKIHDPEVADVVKNAEQTSDVAAEATGGTGDGATTGEHTGEGGVAEESGAVTDSGSGTTEQGGGARAEPTTERGGATGDEKPIRSKSVDKLVDKAGNIRLENLTNDEEARAALRAIAAKTPLLDHDVIGDQEIAELAKALGVKAKEINIEKLRQLAIEDNLPLAARVRASREMLLEADKNVRELAGKVENGTSADLQAFTEAHNRFLMISETVSAITNQIGRAMRAFQDISGDKRESANQLETLFQQEMNKTAFDMKDLAKLVASKTENESIAKVIQDSAKPGFWDHFAEYRRCSILSGFVTHALWLTGTSINLLYKPIVLDTLGGIRNEIGMALGKEDTGSTITGGIEGLYHAITKALPNILSATGTAIRTGKTVLRPFEGELDTYLATGGIRKTLNINMEALRAATDSAFNISDYPELKALQAKLADAVRENNADKVAGLQLKLDEQSLAKKKEVAQKIAAQIQSRLKTWGELAGEIHDFGSSAMASALAVGKNIIKPSESMKDKPGFEARREKGVLPDLYIKGVPVAPIGTVMRGMSSRIYSSMHTFAREVAANIETLQEARRIAVKEGLEGEDLISRVNNLLSSPTKELMQKVNSIANKQTLMSNESEWAKAATRIRNAIDFHTNTKIGSVLMPVVGVPAEAVRQTVAESSPLGWLDKRERDALLGHLGPVEQERAQVKMLAGTALIGLGLYMGQKGIATPSPSINYKQEQERRDAGQQSASLRIGDTMASLAHVPITGTLLTLGADIGHIMSVYRGEDLSDKIKPAIASAINNFLLHENALVELSDAVNAVRGATDVSGYLKNQAVSTIVPAFIKQGNDLLDPSLRDSRSFISSLLSRIPVESETLPPRINALTGEPLPREPLHTHTAIGDPIAQQLMSLHIFPTSPHPVINGVDLTGQQNAEYASIKGHILHNGLEMLMQGDGKNDFDNADMTGKRKMIQRIENHASQCAKSAMFNKYPDLLKDANNKYEANCIAETQ